MQGTSTYNDRLFRWAVAVAVAYYVSEFGGEGYFSLKRLQTREFLIEYASTLFITLLLVEFIAWISRILDQRYGWRENKVLRAVLQTLLGVVIPVLLDLLLASIYFRLFDVDIRDTNYFNEPLQHITVLIILFNAYCIIRYLWTNERPPRQTVEVFEAYAGTGKHMVHVQSIAYFYRYNDQLFLYTFDKQEYLLHQSLASIMKKRSSSRFFQANRQLIINIETVRSSRFLKNRQVQLSLQPSPPHGIPSVVSRGRANDFRSWVNLQRGEDSN